MKVGDVHAYNCKLDEKVNVFAVYDDINQKPRYVSAFGDDFLKSTYSLDVFYWERVETTTALNQ